MPQRLHPYRTTSFVGFVGIFLFAVVALAHLPAFGPAETLVHGLAWIGVAGAGRFDRPPPRRSTPAGLGFPSPRGLGFLSSPAPLLVGGRLALDFLRALG